MKPILPGATIGVLGSGQLGRMFGIAARRMGYRVHTFSDRTDSPMGQLCDLEVAAPFNDLDAIQDFARAVDVVTFEFENVPAKTVEAAQMMVPVHPAGNVLHVCQNRLREKEWLQKHGFPVAPFRRVSCREDLEHALQELGCPAVLKTAGFGYDGKGQSKINALDDVEDALQNLGDQEGVLEGFVSFEREVSVVAARGLDGQFAHWGVVENEHYHHILDVTLAPASLPPRVAHEAIEMARGVLEQLEVVGVLCVEFFLRGEQLIINELAPRPHNSGHWSFDACVTSQFEGQLRAVCGLPQGSTQALRPAAMANLLGDLWAQGEPHWAGACAFPDVKLHLYGKGHPRPGRKMGHLTAMAESVDEAARLVRQARAALTVS